MADPTPPPGSSMTFGVGDTGGVSDTGGVGDTSGVSDTGLADTKRVTCPPRRRGRNALFALTGAGAGSILAMVSIGTDVLEWDGATFRHVIESRWRRSTVMEIAIEALDPLDPPTRDEIPELADAAALAKYRAPLLLRYTPEDSAEVCIYQCMASLDYEEHHWLASVINPCLPSQEDDE
jgi:hypothetical protein